MSAGPRQYDRRLSLFVANAAGDGLELGQLRVVFTVGKSDAQAPNWASIAVYNLAEATAARIRREFTRVVLQAGYRDNLGVVFDGTIKQARTGRDNGTDTFLEIAAADGDRAYNGAIVNKTLASATANDQVRAALEPMSAHGVEGGFLEDLGGPSLPRGKVLFGMSRDVLRTATRSRLATWSIQDGRVQVVKRAGVLPGEAVSLNSATGLIGAAEQSEKGIKARCLLNPRLRVGGLVKLNQADVEEQRLDAPAPASGSTSAGAAPEAKPAKIAGDGFYRLWAVQHSGDTRGNDWYSDLLCLAADVTAPPSVGAVDPQ